VVAAAISAVVTATIPTAAQQAKETAQGGQSKESNGVACASMADAPLRGSPMVDCDESYFFFSLLSTEMSRLGLDLCIVAGDVHILM